jgi:hypothetical protein
MTSSTWFALIWHFRAPLCLSRFVTASLRTVASTVSTFSSRAPQLTSTSTAMPAATSREVTELASFASEMFR